MKFLPFSISFKNGHYKRRRDQGNIFMHCILFATCIFIINIIIILFRFIGKWCAQRPHQINAFWIVACTMRVSLCTNVLTFQKRVTIYYWKLWSFKLVAFELSVVYILRGKWVEKWNNQMFFFSLSLWKFVIEQ